MWSKTSLSDNSRTNNPTPDEDDDGDDDDIVELPDTRVSSLKHQAVYPASFARTPPHSSRESPASSATRPNKRPASEVIDLTLSDDDDAPLPKVKRSSTITDAARGRFPETTLWSAPRPPSQTYSPYPDWSSATS
jgi:E3 SUMO-protein ligase PIAS1